MGTTTSVSFKLARNRLRLTVPEHERYIADVLLPGEDIVWMGRPRKGWVLTRLQLFLLVLIGGPIATGLWAGIVALGGLVGAAEAEFVFGVFAPVVALPIAFATCAEFAAIYRSRIAYFVTDRRVGASRRDVTANVDELPHEEWTSMLVERAEPNSGNVVFRSRNAERSVRWEVLEDLDAALHAIKPYQDYKASDGAWGEAHNAA